MKPLNRLPPAGVSLWWVLQTLPIPGPLPGGNKILGAKRQSAGGGGDQYAREKRLFTDYMLALCKAHATRPVWCGLFSFTWDLDSERHPRRGPGFDPDNLVMVRKWILDGLVAARVLHDDQPRDVWPHFDPQHRPKLPERFVEGGWTDDSRPLSQFDYAGVVVRCWGPQVDTDVDAGTLEMGERRARLDSIALTRERSRAQRRARKAAATTFPRLDRR